MNAPTPTPGCFSAPGWPAPPRPEPLSSGAAPHARPVDHLHAEAPPGEAVEALDPRVAALLPAQLLQPGEVVILLLKPSPWFILLEPLRTLAAIVIVFMLALVTPGFLGAVASVGMGRRDLMLLLMLVLGIRLFWQFLEWLSRVYVLTDRRVIRIQGVVRVLIFEAQLKKIQHTTLTFSARERLAGLGTIGFATAGTAFTEAYWRMVANPMDVHRVVTQTINRAR
jgi:hypothetical protein